MRLARLLARRIEESGRDRSRPLTVAELREELVPYPLCRRQLGFTTKAEYDLALLRLLADPGLTETDDELAEAVERELRGPEPKLEALEPFPEAPVRTASGFPSAGEREAGIAGGAGEGSDRGPEGAEAAREGTPPPGEAPGAARDRAARGPRGAGGKAAPGAADSPGAEVRGGTRSACAACGTRLPDLPSLRFCPRCGADQREPRCGACGEDVEAEWRYCPACGDELGRA